MQNNHAIVVRSDARAMSAVTALDTRVSARWLPSKADKRTFDHKPFTGTSNCISYKLDDAGNKVDAKVFRTVGTRTRKPNRRSSVNIVSNDYALMAKMGTIHQAL
jgi:hypothetical protein